MSERLKASVEAARQELKQTVVANNRAAAERAQDAEAKARAQLATTEAELANVRGERDFWRSTSPVAADVADAPAPTENGGSREADQAGTANKRMRRKHFPDDPEGIFRTERADRTIVFEIKTGQHPWETVGPDRDEAIARLRELKGEAPEVEAAGAAKSADVKPRPSTGILPWGRA